MKSTVWFVPFVPRRLTQEDSIGSRWLRLLGRLRLGQVVADRKTIVKMHLGGGTGFTTIHPWLTRTLVEHLNKAGAASVRVTDTAGAVATAVERGYAPATIGCRLTPVCGHDDTAYVRRPVTSPLRTLKHVDVGRTIHNAEALIVFTHLKAHGACGFGGSAKNLAMGCVTGRTRRALHALEGGWSWDPDRCTRCGLCVTHCPSNALELTGKRLRISYHHCTFCRHCEMVCPTQAVRIHGGRYRDFQQGLAEATARVLEGFAPDRVLYINVLINITLYCDCWGMTTPSVVPDIGILASRDLVAIEQASLDLVRVSDLIRRNLPPGYRVGRQGHLFQRLHGKDPTPIVGALAERGLGSRTYRLTTIA